MNTKNSSVNTKKSLPKNVNNSNQELFSTKQIAEQLTVSTKTIRENAKKCLPNKVFEHGKTTYWTKEEVTVLLDYLQNNTKGQGSRNDLTCTEVVQVTKTELTPALKVQQFISSIDYNDESAVDMVTATITALSSNLIAALHGENKSLVKENKMLKHQVEYNEVIGCSRWADVKKLLGIKESWETICNLLNLEENVDYFKKCMGYDKYPTVLLPDNTIARIKKEICKK